MTLTPHEHFRRRLGALRGELSVFHARAPLLHDPEFEDWRTDAIQTLRKLFPDGRYADRMERLQFRHATNDSPRLGWLPGYREVWEAALLQANRIIVQAEEEWTHLPQATSDQAASERAREPQPPSVIVNLNNIFSPSVHFTLNQALVEAGNLGLESADQERVESNALALDAAAKAEDWPAIGRTVEALKFIGKGAYEKVALPLLAEIIKRHLT